MTSTITGWKAGNLGTLCNIEIGGTPSRNVAEFWDDSKQMSNYWVSIRDLNKRIILETNERISDLGVRHSNVKLQKSGTVLLSFKLSIGRVAFAGNDLYTNEAIAGLYSDELDAEFLYYGLQQWDLLQNVDQAIKGATLNKAKLKQIEFEYPFSKKEQTKIAEILSTLDQAIEQNEAIIAKQQRIKTGLMQDLLTKGIDENGNIRSEATHEFKDSPLGRIPVDWDTKPLIDVLVEIGQGWSPDCATEVADIGDWGVLKTTAVTWDGYQSTENKRLPNTLKPRPKLEVQKGDVLMTRAGPNSRVGVICYVYQTEEKRIFSDKLYKLKPNSSVDGRFLVFSLSGFQSQRYLSALKTGMAESQTNISQEIVKKMLTICPDKIEQVRLSNLLDKICQEGSKNNCVLAKLKKLKTGLMHDLLTGKVRVSDIQNPISTAESLCPPLN
jgi:type I restriction enzyme, S subunit